MLHASIYIYIYIADHEWAAYFSAGSKKINKIKIKPSVSVVVYLDQLDEGDEEAPGVGPVDDETLQQDSRYLLLDDLLPTPTRIRGKQRRHRSRTEGPESVGVWMGATRKEQGGAHLLGLEEQEEEDEGEIVGVVVGVAELVGDGVEEEVAPLRVQVHGQRAEYVHRSADHHSIRRPRVAHLGSRHVLRGLALQLLDCLRIPSTET